MTRKVTTLKHELRDHTVELGVNVALALLLGAQSTEVLRSLGDDIVEELKVDHTSLGYSGKASQQPSVEMGGAI